MYMESLRLAGLAIAMVAMGAANSSAQNTLNMPQELVQFARSNSCAPISDFFERPGMINPPYVYGWLSGDKEKSAVFWCKQADDGISPYRLMFIPADPQQLGGCPAVIKWHDAPRGLSIQKRARLVLRNFRYVNTPSRHVPPRTVSDARVLVNYYDGVQDVFYCDRGNWVVSSSD
jgi:hypothetical protein